ncbi:MarR family winged helix-turn-helix transcriptional regulator [Clostridium fallax]|uniref:Transcriptional regulator, MarR family n=1 Tax=Clostridium fallax TaxID=1533 RepID=A0A1M4WB60_9CLOT|nr:MarR family transcriptional regulator [Clostridium fallax]SHE78405.1 transcriptional regulator, MarR family [Clostridium fallax]SQB05917.1 MarR family transcriptional regulator [Clostridium fallax]
MEERIETIYYAYLQNIKAHYQRIHMALEKLGLYPGQPYVLLALESKDGQSQKELSDRISVKPSTLTIVLGRMEKANLIYRKSDKEDQRISRVYLTDRGIKICKEIKELEKDLEKEYFKDFTQEEKIIFRRLLIQMTNNLKEIIEYEKNNK